jgi:arsenate reductase (glutaredoxin)
MPLTLYGIPNCDTVKKARAWLADHGVEYTFHDFRKGGVPPERLDAWLRAAGWARLLNRQGSTWRKLDPQAQLRGGNEKGARELMLAQPSVVKRPVVEWPDGTVTVGFDAARWASLRAA